MTLRTQPWVHHPACITWRRPSFSILRLPLKDRRALEEIRAILREGMRHAAPDQMGGALPPVHHTPRQRPSFAESREPAPSREDAEDETSSEDSDALPCRCTRLVRSPATRVHFCDVLGPFSCADCTRLRRYQRSLTWVNNSTANHPDFAGAITRETTLLVRRRTMQEKKACGCHVGQIIPQRPGPNQDDRTLKSRTSSTWSRSDRTGRQGALSVTSNSTVLYRGELSTCTPPLADKRNFRVRSFTK
jgi:hypothetical protein